MRSPNLLEIEFFENGSRKRREWVVMALSGFPVRKGTQKARKPGLDEAEVSTKAKAPNNAQIVSKNKLGSRHAPRAAAARNQGQQEAR